MKAFLEMLLIGMVALSPAAAQQTSPVNDHLIVPGQRIGPIKLGANIKDVIMALGSPLDASDSSGGKPIVIFWSSGGATLRVGLGTWTTPECTDTRTFNTPKCQILEAFVIDDHDYATAEGLHIGVLGKQVRDVLGEPNRIISGTHSLMYSSGILFYVNDKPGDDYQRVTQIYVRPRNCLKEVPCT